jgi:hypothetical protein
MGKTAKLVFCPMLSGSSGCRNICFKAAAVSLFSVKISVFNEWKSWDFL